MIAIVIVNFFVCCLMLSYADTFVSTETFYLRNNVLVFVLFSAEM